MSTRSKGGLIFNRLSSYAEIEAVLNTLRKSGVVAEPAPPHHVPELGGDCLSYRFALVGDEKAGNDAVSAAVFAPNSPLVEAWGYGKKTGGSCPDTGGWDASQFVKPRGSARTAAPAAAAGTAQTIHTFASTNTMATTVNSIVLSI